MYPDMVDLAKLLVGTRQIVRAAARGRLEQVYLATDADHRIRQQVISACTAMNIPIEEVSSMQELGKWCRIAVGAATAGLLKM